MNTTLIAVIIAAVISFGAGWQVRDWQADSDKLEVANHALAGFKTALIDHGKLTQENADRAASLEETIALMEDSKQEVQIIREKEYVEKPVYNSCIVPDSGVRLINDRIAARHPTTSKTAERKNALPGAEKAKKPGGHE